MTKKLSKKKIIVKKIFKKTMGLATLAPFAQKKKKFLRVCRKPYYRTSPCFGFWGGLYVVILSLAGPIVGIPLKGVSVVYLVGIEVLHTELAHSWIRVIP
jgi:hypothetical protein